MKVYSFKVPVVEGIIASCSGMEYDATECGNKAQAHKIHKLAIRFGQQYHKYLTKDLIHLPLSLNEVALTKQVLKYAIATVPDLSAEYELQKVLESI